MKNIIDKMRSRGVESLDDDELVTLVVAESATDEEAMSIARNALTEHDNSMSRLAGLDMARLRMVSGMGRRRAERLKLAAELGRRVALSEAPTADKIDNDSDVVRLMQPLIGGLKHEECWVLYLTSSNRVIERMRISQGGIQATVVDCRLIIKRALELLSTRIILTHNHPSGSATPSPQDRALTDKVRAAAQLFDIELTDHVIVASTGHYSFRAAGELR